MNTIDIDAVKRCIKRTDQSIDVLNEVLKELDVMWIHLNKNDTSGQKKILKLIKIIQAVHHAQVDNTWVLSVIKNKEEYKKNKP